MNELFLQLYGQILSSMVISKNADQLQRQLPALEQYAVTLTHRAMMVASNQPLPPIFNAPPPPVQHPESARPPVEDGDPLMGPTSSATDYRKKPMQEVTPETDRPVIKAEMTIEEGMEKVDRWQTDAQSPDLLRRKILGVLDSRTDLDTASKDLKRLRQLIIDNSDAFSDSDKATLQETYRTTAQALNAKIAASREQEIHEG